MLIIVYKSEVLKVLDNTAKYLFSLQKKLGLFAIHDGDLSDARKGGVVTGKEAYTIMRGNKVRVLPVRVFLNPELPTCIDRGKLCLKKSMRIEHRDGYWRGVVVTNVGPGILFVPLFFISSEHPLILELLREDRKRTVHEKLANIDILYRLYPNLEVLGVEEEGSGVRITIHDHDVGRSYWIFVSPSGVVNTNVCIENIEMFKWWEIPALVRLANSRGRLFIYGEG